MEMIDIHIFAASGEVISSTIDITDHQILDEEDDSSDDDIPAPAGRYSWDIDIWFSIYTYLDIIIILLYFEDQVFLI